MKSTCFGPKAVEGLKCFLDMMMIRMLLLVSCTSVCREEYGACWTLFVEKDHKLSLALLEEFYCY